MKQKKLALSLRGGGARCCTYFGFLKALEENNIKIDMIIGSSGGALISAPYALDVPIQKIIEHQDKWSIRKYTGYDALKDRTIISDEKAIQYIYDIVGVDTDIKDTNIEYYVQVTNLHTNDSQILEDGNLATALEASSAIPMVLPPIKIDDNLCVDGDISSGFAANFLRGKGAEVVIGLETVLDNAIESKDLSIIDRLITPFRISQSKYLQLDLIVNPVDLLVQFNTTKYGLFEYGKNREMCEVGYEVSKEYIEQIKELLFS